MGAAGAVAMGATKATGATTGGSAGVGAKAAFTIGEGSGVVGVIGAACAGASSVCNSNANAPALFADAIGVDEAAGAPVRVVSLTGAAAPATSIWNKLEESPPLVAISEAFGVTARGARRLSIAFVAAG
jgi:hypothetical protein